MRQIGLTSSQAAREANVSKQTIENAVNSGSIVRDSSGKIDRSSFKGWKERRERKDDQTQSNPVIQKRVDLDTERARKEKALADRYERENRIAAKELIPFSEVHDMQAAMYARLRSHLRATFLKVPAVCGVPTDKRPAIRKKLDLLERDLLETIARTDLETTNDEPS